MLTRRSILKAIAAIPFVGLLAKVEAKPLPISPDDAVECRSPLSWRMEFTLPSPNEFRLGDVVGVDADGNFVRYSGKEQPIGFVVKQADNGPTQVSSF